MSQFHYEALSAPAANHATDHPLDCVPRPKRANSKIKPLERSVARIDLRRSPSPGQSPLMVFQVEVSQRQVVHDCRMPSVAAQRLLTRLNPLLVPSREEERDGQVLPGGRIVALKLCHAAQASDGKSMLRAVHQKIGQIEQQIRII